VTPTIPVRCRAPHDAPQGHPQPDGDRYVYPTLCSRSCGACEPRNRRDLRFSVGPRQVRILWRPTLRRRFRRRSEAHLRFAARAPGRKGAPQSAAVAAVAAPAPDPPIAVNRSRLLGSPPRRRARGRPLCASGARFAVQHLPRTAIGSACPCRSQHRRGPFDQFHADFGGVPKARSGFARKGSNQPAISRAFIEFQNISDLRQKPVDRPSRPMSIDPQGQEIAPCSI
jgi:hypothetical protein